MAVRTTTALLLLCTGAMLGCQAHASNGGEPSSLEWSDADASQRPLPSAVKGYELYVWEQDGVLSFTLITGTNRLKTVQEITGADEEPRSGDWVVVRGEGTDELRRTLARIPADTSVVMPQLAGLPPLDDVRRAEINELVANR